MTNLVIVESPTKAKTIKRFLGKGYTVKSSYGHIRDLPKKEMGIDIENDFEPTYIIPPKAKKTVSTLKTDVKKADTVYLATDEDREGEAISWHLVHALKLKKDVIKRITFHEITKNAIEEALKNARDLDQDLIDAQQARRVLDRLVGYELSPFLWKKIKYGLSAGRVQSVCVRLIVEREREIEAFKPQEYWTITADVSKSKKPKKEAFPAKLVKVDGKRLDKFGLSDKKSSDKIVKDLKDADYTVVDLTKKEKLRRPLPPYTTSTLQQDAGRRLGFSAKQTMMLAQQLYEGVVLGSEGSTGLITYMRTDSMSLATSAIDEARNVLQNKFGKEFVPAKPRFYKTKSKGAQEAHEAIRPTMLARMPEDLKSHLDSRQLKLYELIWKRTLACQAEDAKMDATTIDISAGKHAFRATGSVITFPGFLEIYQDGGAAVNEIILPEVKKAEKLDLHELKPEQHFTQPPARYSEAGLVKKLEELGIGRPSTYAPTISTVQDRGYVEKEEKRLKPTEIGTLVNDVLVEHFPQIVDYQFTARLEEDLDTIAIGKKEWVPVIRDFYKPFIANLKKKDKELSKKDLTEEASDEVCEKCGKPMIIKMGRFGRFYACTGYPDCKTTKPMEGEKEALPPEEVADEQCPECGEPMVVKRGRFGPFL
ncbi:type I DNA topoisomerase, partial [Patescibacteria group bacterium]